MTDEKQMRPATPEERQGEEEYIDSISEPTGVNFNDLLKHDEKEWINECFDKLYDAPTVEDKPQGEEKNICDSCGNKACIFDSHVARQKCDFYKPQPKTEQFAKWVATEIFDENWEYNKDAFAEIACRKLAKLGIVRAKGDEWELIEPQERSEKG